MVFIFIDFKKFNFIFKYSNLTYFIEFSYYFGQNYIEVQKLIQSILYFTVKKNYWAQNFHYNFAILMDKYLSLFKVSKRIKFDKLKHLSFCSVFRTKYTCLESASSFESFKFSRLKRLNLCAATCLRAFDGILTIIAASLAFFLLKSLNYEQD